MKNSKSTSYIQKQKELAQSKEYLEADEQRKFEMVLALHILETSQIGLFTTQKT